MDRRPSSPTSLTGYAYAALLLCALLIPGVALAQATNLPYEDGLATLRTSLTGPVPFIISLVGIVACGAMLIFGGEISGFLRTLVFIVLVISIIVQATQVVELLGGSWTGDVRHAVALGLPLGGLV
ncbi:TrbC/VirB2 family protein [Luteibacter sp. 329MFSha]|uniref:TrbC/VirB2 family protein n=1 Tax=Luteibacter sp. 329MFSha TaxID=1798239 RepID=UPI000A731124|nr:TrbC/VirB2 family protein [Luteibacter sp. 329MFSha]